MSSITVSRHNRQRMLIHQCVNQLSRRRTPILIAIDRHKHPLVALCRCGCKLFYNSRRPRDLRGMGAKKHYANRPRRNVARMRTGVIHAIFAHARIRWLRCCRR